jgi:hypothetical protein
MNAHYKLPPRLVDPAGFSLVEVTVAIGIFAFVVVGVLGMFPAGMRMRADSSQETRGMLIAQELFASVAASPSVRAVVMRDGPGLRPGNNISPAADLTLGPVVVGYPTRTTVPYGLWHSSRGGSPESGGDPEGVWSRGELPGWALSLSVDALARISATNVAPGLFQVNVEVRAPANIPLTNSRPISFSTLVYSP